MTVDASSELWAQIPSWEDMGLSQQVGNDHALCECVCVRDTKCATNESCSSEGLLPSEHGGGCAAALVQSECKLGLPAAQKEAPRTSCTRSKS